MRTLIRKNVVVSITCGLAVVALFIGAVWLVFRFTPLSLKDSTTAVPAVGTVIAIWVGGLFAFYRLQLFRTFEPHLTITQQVSHRSVGESYVHIVVTATLVNSSRVKIELREGFFLLQQIAPADDELVERLYNEVFVDPEFRVIQWPTLEEIPLAWTESELIIEPGESHDEPYEFIVSSEVESVVVYSYFYNPGAGQRGQVSEGWAATTVHDIVDLR